jgi:mannose-6-phosphate isomerase-like protein (cupin superfamily)
MTIQKRNFADIPPRAAPNRLIRELFSGKSLGAQAITFRVIDMLPAAQQEPRRPHSHPDFEEVIFILSGRGQLWVEGEWHALRPGDAVLVPAGVVHATFNTTDEPLRLASFFPVPAGVDETRRRSEVLIAPDEAPREAGE